MFGGTNVRSVFLALDVSVFCKLETAKSVISIMNRLKYFKNKAFPKRSYLVLNVRVERLEIVC